MSYEGVRMSLATNKAGWRWGWWEFDGTSRKALFVGF